MLNCKPGACNFTYVFWACHAQHAQNFRGVIGACLAKKYIISNALLGLCRVAQNAWGVVKGVVKGVTRASFRRRAPLTPQLKRASARRREEKVFRGVYMIQQVAAVHLGWGQAPSLDTNSTYEIIVWVPLDLTCENLGCYLGRREGVLAA